MPKYGRFQFADNAEIQRRAGSDWMYDKKREMEEAAELGLRSQ